MRCWKRRLIALMMLPLMSGCAGGSSEPEIITCPALVTYSSADQAALRAELAAAGPITHRFIDDYAGLRDQVRACRSHR